MTNQDLLFIPASIQKFLYLMYLNDKKICFDTQNIYKSRQNFYKIINNLIRWNAVKRRECFINGRVANMYDMTLDGVLFIEKFVIDYDKCTNKK